MNRASFGGYLSVDYDVLYYFLACFEGRPDPSVLSPESLDKYDAECMIFRAENKPIEEIPSTRMDAGTRIAHSLCGNQV